MQQVKEQAKSAKLFIDQQQGSLTLEELTDLKTTFSDAHDLGAQCTTHLLSDKYQHMISNSSLLV